MKIVQFYFEEDADFGRKIIFSDEVHFHLSGYVNKQNCRIWGTENPHVFVEKPMHPQRVTVWCGLWSGGHSLKMRQEPPLQSMASAIAPCFRIGSSRYLKRKTWGQHLVSTRRRSVPHSQRYDRSCAHSLRRPNYQSKF